MEFCHLVHKLCGCNKEVATSHSGHYTWVLLYTQVYKLCFRYRVTIFSSFISYAVLNGEGLITKDTAGNSSR